MIQYMLQVTIAMALLIVPYFLFFQKETFFRFNRAYLITALAIAILAPFAPRWISIADPSVAYVLLQPIEITSMAEVTITADAAEQGRGIWYFLSISYWIVAMVLIARLIIEISGIAKIYQEGEKENYNGDTIIVHESIKAPFSFFNAVFLSPEVRNDYTQFSNIFKHEVTHIRHRHSIDAVLVEFLCAIFWINPLIYVYKRALKAIHEFQADNVVEETDLVEYTQLLLSQSQSGLRLVLTNQFFQSQLKSRIVMMMKQRSNEVNKWKYMFALPVLAMAILLFSFKNSDVLSINDTDGETFFEHSIILQDTFRKNNSGVYMEAEEMPRFPGCEEVKDKDERSRCAQKMMLQYVYENIKYPAEAQKNGIEGSVVLQFNVSTNGEIEGVNVVRGIGGGCDEECLRVINSMNNFGTKWTPGKIEGKPVKVQYTIPVKFKLSSDGEAKAKLADSEVYKEVEHMPLFPGCNDVTCSNTKLLEYVIANLKYPEEARTGNIEGKVFVSFVVEPNGTISSIKVVKGFNTACDAEVIRVIESMNSMPGQWTPGMHKGDKVRVQFTLPVMFKL
ncbi:MAG: hypothetical protein DRI69_01325 [Bacteroidetes bacterium]|nr:MAG: hypothetical protein DRI69_01325 [Bacteroidota bacterium]